MDEASYRTRFRMRVYTTISGVAKISLTRLILGLVSLGGSLTVPVSSAAPPPQVWSIVPNSASNNISALVTIISGSNFDGGASALLTQSGQTDIVGTDVAVTDSGATNLAATFSVDNVMTGAWNVVVINSDSQSSTLTNGFTVLAVPPVQTFQISTSPSPAAGGATSGDGTYTNGTGATVTATPNSCYTFVNWTDQNSNVVSTSLIYSFTVSTNLTLVANFIPILYAITATNSPVNGGTVSSVGTVLCGSNITVCATPSSCYSFVNWTDPSSNVLSAAACYTFTAVTNGALVANFAPVGVPTNSSLTTLWTFPGGSGGASPEGPLVQGNDGNFYGTTVYGGPNGSGTVFRITPDGSLTNLHFFSGNDGAYPSAGLVQGSDGNFYGTTANGGASGYGTVFRISSNGALTTLVSFTNGLDGGYPYSSLIQAGDGNFYGTTLEGGLTGGGTAFRMTPSGSLTNLCSFTGNGAGIFPFAGLDPRYRRLFLRHGHLRRRQ